MKFNCYDNQIHVLPPGAQLSKPNLGFFSFQFLKMLWINIPIDLKLLLAKLQMWGQAQAHSFSLNQPQEILFYIKTSEKLMKKYLQDMQILKITFYDKRNNKVVGYSVINFKRYIGSGGFQIQQTIELFKDRKTRSKFGEMQIKLKLSFIEQDVINKTEMTKKAVSEFSKQKQSLTQKIIVQQKQNQKVIESKCKNKLQNQNSIQQIGQQNIKTQTYKSIKQKQKFINLFDKQQKVINTIQFLQPSYFQKRPKLVDYQKQMEQLLFDQAMLFPQEQNKKTQTMNFNLRQFRVLNIKSNIKVEISIPIISQNLYQQVLNRNQYTFACKSIKQNIYTINQTIPIQINQNLPQYLEKQVNKQKMTIKLFTQPQYTQIAYSQINYQNIVKCFKRQQIRKQILDLKSLKKVKLKGKQLKEFEKIGQMFIDIDFPQSILQSKKSLLFQSLPQLCQQEQQQVKKKKLQQKVEKQSETGKLYQLYMQIIKCNLPIQTYKRNFLIVYLPGLQAYRSKTIRGTVNPKFNFNLICPILSTSQKIQYQIQIWNRSQKQQLLGIIKQKVPANVVQNNLYPTVLIQGQKQFKLFNDDQYVYIDMVLAIGTVSQINRFSQKISIQNKIDTYQQTTRKNEQQQQKTQKRKSLQEKYSLKSDQSQQKEFMRIYQMLNKGLQHDKSLHEIQHSQQKYKKEYLDMILCPSIRKQP